ncbi:zeta toxin family protein [Leclercia adecarboxylata]|uniref:zeta toxin family protein n=1 Tax=Leclercia adecarboxylata TaxID=83655 RepID=UPI00384F89B8
MDANHKKELLNKIASDYENEINKASLVVARHIKEDVFKYLSNDIKAADTPSIIFTAGAPACGKSETVKYILQRYPSIVHIDPDEFRGLFPYYLGSNAENYQKSCTHIMSYCFNKAVRGNFDIIHDTNFAHVDTAIANVREALKRKYLVQIYYVYMDPRLAWKHAMQRDRKILPDVFCRNFGLVRDTIKAVLSHPDIKGKQIRCRAFVYEQKSGQPGFTTTIHDDVTAESLDTVVPFGYSTTDLAEIAV